MPNASIPTPEPVKQRKMFGAYGKSVGKHSVAFISQVLLNPIFYMLSATKNRFSLWFVFTFLKDTYSLVSRFVVKEQ